MHVLSSSIAVSRALEVGGIDDDVGAREVAHLVQLGSRERGLRRPAPPDDDDSHRRALDGVDRRVGRVGRRELLVREREHPRDVERDVAVPDHDRALGREVELES